jgi:hypothetical protein
MFHRLKLEVFAIAAIGACSSPKSAPTTTDGIPPPPAIEQPEQQPPPEGE